MNASDQTENDVLDIDSASILIGDVLGKKPSGSCELGQEVFIVGVESQPHYTPVSPFIYRTYVTEILASGRIGVVSMKDGTPYFSFDEAYAAYAETVKNLIRNAQRRVDDLIAFQSAIPDRDSFLKTVEAETAGMCARDMFELEPIFSYEEVLKNVRQPKFHPMETVYALLLPDGHTTYFGVKPPPYDIVTVRIERVCLWKDGSVHYWNSSMYILEEGQFFRSKEAAIAARESVIGRDVPSDLRAGIPEPTFAPGKKRPDEEKSDPVVPTVPTAS